MGCAKDIQQHIFRVLSRRQVDPQMRQQRGRMLPTEVREDVQS